MLIGPILVLTVLYPVNTSENNTYDIILGTLTEDIILERHKK